MPVPRPGFSFKTHSVNKIVYRLYHYQLKGTSGAGTDSQGARYRYNTLPVSESEFAALLYTIYKLPQTYVSNMEADHLYSWIRLTAVLRLAKRVC